MPKQRTHEEAVKLVNSFDHILCSRYINNLKRVTLYHKGCKRKYERNLKEFLKYDGRCTLCMREQPNGKSLRQNVS